MQGFFAECTLSPFDFAQGRSQNEGERAQNDNISKNPFNKLLDAAGGALPSQGPARFLVK